MPIRSRRIVVALAALFGLLSVLGFAAPGHATVDNFNLAQALRAGGFVIVVRHGATFPDQADTDPLNFDNVAAQRNLNDKGKALARAFGDAILEAGVPVGKVFTSKYNRAYESKRPQMLLRAVSWCRRTRTTAASTLFTSCSELCRRLVPTRFSLHTSPTSSMHSARTGSTSKKARHRSSAPITAATSSLHVCRWKNGLALRLR